MNNKSSYTNRILTPQERRQRNRDEMRTAILIAARDIMREEGVGALTMHELARRVELRTSSLYVYFPSKMAIYDALYEFGVRTYREEILPILQPLNDPWEILQALLENFMTLSIQNPELFQIVFERPIPGFVPSEASMTETRRMLRDTFMQLNRVVPEQEYDFEQYVPATHGLIMAMMQGLTAAHLANDPGIPEGSGRFASLIPGAVELFKTAWGYEASLPSSAMNQEK